MLTEAELLQYIYQTTEMGRDGIQSVLPHAEDETFTAPEQQLTECGFVYATGKMLRKWNVVILQGSIPWSRHPEMMSDENHG
ncbi:MAG: hypothetical protein ACLRWQ_12930 [Flavonifractor plautii]